MNNYKQHQKLLKQVLKAMQERFPSGRFFQRHVGLFKTITGKPIKINSKGMADLWGIIDGQHIEVEIKTGKGRQTKDQKNWQKAVENMGSKYYLIRDVSEVSDMGFD